MSGVRVAAALASRDRLGVRRRAGRADYRGLCQVVPGGVHTVQGGQKVMITSGIDFLKVLLGKRLTVDVPVALLIILLIKRAITNYVRWRV